MLCRKIDLRWNFFLNVEKILKNILSRKRKCDDDDNWLNSSFNFDFVESSRDLNTKNSFDVRYFFVEIQKTLHVSRNAVLFTTHFEKFSKDSTQTTRMIRNLILIESNRICDLIFVIIIIWMICKNSSIKIFRANLWSASQNWFKLKVWMMIVSFK